MPPRTVTLLFDRSAAGATCGSAVSTSRTTSTEADDVPSGVAGQTRWSGRRRALPHRSAEHCVVCGGVSDENGNFRLMTRPVDPLLPPPVRSPAMPPPALPPVGWYRQATDGHDRWWDGRGWTEHVQHRPE